LRASPVVALQRALAVAELAGPVGGLDAIAAIEGRERLAAYPFYFAAMGELELRKGNRDVARAHLEAALAVARSGMERRFLLLRVAACEGASGA
jgi:RNA polymerase sigma-70 factor (ECF subfamily)